MAPRAKYDQVTTTVVRPKPVQFIGTNSSHRLVQKPRFDGLHKLRLAGRGKERLLVSHLLNLLAASQVSLPAFYHQAVAGLAFIYRSCFPGMSLAEQTGLLYDDNKHVGRRCSGGQGHGEWMVRTVEHARRVRSSQIYIR